MNHAEGAGLMDPIEINYRELETHTEHHQQASIGLQRILGRRMVMSASTSFFGYGIQAFILHGIVATHLLLMWVAALAVAEGCNGALALAIYKPATPSATRDRLVLALRLGLLLVGSVWGAVVLLPHVAADPSRLLIHSMALGLAAILGVYNLCNDRLCLAAFTVGLGWPSVYGWSVPGVIPFELGIATLSLCALCQIYGASNRRLMRGFLLSNLVSKQTALQLAESNAALKALSDQLKDAASTDALTGCLNRRGLLAEMEKELARATRSQASFCVFIFDLDKFKSINDNHGHGVGDLVLKSTAAQLKQKLRVTDYLGRWGGEEFVCLLANAGLEQGLAKAEDMRAAIAQAPVDTGQALLTVTTSIGVACYSGTESISQLIDAADKKLYEAKQSGRNKVCG